MMQYVTPHMQYDGIETHDMTYHFGMYGILAEMNHTGFNSIVHPNVSNWSAFQAVTIIKKQYLSNSNVNIVT